MEWGLKSPFHLPPLPLTPPLSPLIYYLSPLPLRPPLLSLTSPPSTHITYLNATNTDNKPKSTQT
ncbi:MAG: hypothetical protein K2M41_01645, partial [Muribaculaceae bacterium]|nr:hypothetical protein [Muribaculaceae bacterium]